MSFATFMKKKKPLKMLITSVWSVTTFPPQIEESVHHYQVLSLKERVLWWTRSLSMLVPQHNAYKSGTSQIAILALLQHYFHFCDFPSLLWFYFFIFIKKTCIFKKHVPHLSIHIGRPSVPSMYVFSLVHDDLWPHHNGATHAPSKCHPHSWRQLQAAWNGSWLMSSLKALASKILKLFLF